MPTMKWPKIELPARIDVSADNLGPTFGRFTIAPFEKGMGVVIGNALRRVLLSSLEGTGVTHVRVKGVLHEFSCVPGVLEDVSEIVLNVKQLRVKLFSEGPTVLRVRRTTKGDVRAGDFETDQNTEVVNKDLLVCTLTQESDLEVEVEIRKGRGFVRAEENIRDGQELGTIPVDSNFSPVKRVKFEVQAAPGSKPDHEIEQLVLEVTTDGTVGPEMALVEAAKILRKHLMPFGQFEREGPAPPPPAPVNRLANLNPANALMESPISVLGLSSRAQNSLLSEKIANVRDLVALTEEQLLQIKNFGETSLLEVSKKLADHGLSLGMIP